MLNILLNGGIKIIQFVVGQYSACDKKFLNLICIEFTYKIVNNSNNGSNINFYQRFLVCIFTNMELLQYILKYSGRFYYHTP